MIPVRIKAKCMPNDNLGTGNEGMEGGCSGGSKAVDPKVILIMRYYLDIHSHLPYAPSQKSDFLSFI
jgi:hypothetical protein